VDEQKELALLLLQTAQRDARAFRRLYDLTSPRLLASTLKILRDRPLAEEALQEAFIGIWRNASRYDPLAGAPMTWMTAVARNRALDLVRRRQVHPSVPIEDEPEERAGVTASAEQALADLQMSENLRHCLSELEAAQRQALVLAYAHGLSHAELAAHLARPLGTVKSWVRRGLAALKRCIDSGWEHHEIASR